MAESGYLDLIPRGLDTVVTDRDVSLAYKCKGEGTAGSVCTLLT